MLSKRFVSLKGIFFFFPASIWRLSLSFCLTSGVAGCVLTHFSPVLPPQPYLLRGVQVLPPFPFIGKMRGGGGTVVVSSKLNLSCKFSSSQQKIVLLNILIACILTKLLLIQSRSKTIQDGAAFFFFSFLLKRSILKCKELPAEPG